MNEKGEFVRNEAKLVCKGYSQQEGIDYEETYAPVARMEVVRMFLACATNKKFKVYWMDVKSAFLNGELEEEVYIEQPKGFPLSKDKEMVCRMKKDIYGLKQASRIQYARLDNYLEKLGFSKGVKDNNLYLKEIEEVYIEQPNVFPLTEEKDMVCKLKKDLYGLKQAPRTWYARLDKYLAKLGFVKGTTNSNLYLKEIKDGLLIIIVFVDDIIFGGDDEASNKFLEDMKNEFEMSMIGEMKFFL